MSASLVIPPSMTLGAYRPPEIRIDCLRCKRHASPKTEALRKRFGDGTPIIAVARLLAQEGQRPCGLAGVDKGTQCGVQISAPPVWTYATLYEALHGGWRAYLICRRHLEALKRGRPCPGDIELDIPTLASALGHDFKLQRLFGKCECPKCHTDVIEIQWVVPDPAAPPHPRQQQHPSCGSDRREDRAPSGHCWRYAGGSRERSTMTGKAKMTDEFRREQEARRKQARVVDYLRGATPEQLAKLPDGWRPSGVAHRRMPPATLADLEE